MTTTSSRATESRAATYAHGYSSYTTATHQRRTAESDAAFLLPHIKPTDRVLDVGCGPGTITTGFIKYAPAGSVIGIDISPTILQKAQALAKEADVPASGPGSVKFEEGNVLGHLPYPDNTFDVVYNGQVFGHLPAQGDALKAAIEMRRVVKPGGIVASRAGVDQHFYPRSCDLNRLWGMNQEKALAKGESTEDPTGTRLPAIFRKAGFDIDGGKVHVGAAASASSSKEIREFFLWRARGQFAEGDPFRQSWLDAGISVEEIEETVNAIEKWARTEDAWFASLQLEMLAWK